MRTIKEKIDFLRKIAKSYEEDEILGEFNVYTYSSINLFVDTVESFCKEKNKWDYSHQEINNLFCAYITSLIEKDFDGDNKLDYYSMEAGLGACVGIMLDIEGQWEIHEEFINNCKKTKSLLQEMRSIGASEEEINDTKLKLKQDYLEKELDAFKDTTSSGNTDTEDLIDRMESELEDIKKDLIALRGDIQKGVIDNS